MCLAIALPPVNELENEIPLSHLANGWETNKHGAGMAYVKDGKVVIDKGYMRYGKFKRRFLKLRRLNPDSYFLVHMRYASRGEVSKENTHPFWVHEGESAMIHNGTISINTEKGQSDTGAFANLLSGLPKGFTKVGAFSRLIISYINTDKIAVLTSDNEINIYNSDNGESLNGIWYSNDYYTGEYSRSSNGCKVKRYVDPVEDVTLKCSCGMPLFYEQEFVVGKCVECMGQKEIRDIQLKFGDRECSVCGAVIDPLDVENYADELCYKCYSIYERV